MVSPSADRSGYEGAQPRGLVSLQPLHTPTLGIGAGPARASPASPLAWLELPSVFRAEFDTGRPSNAFALVTGLRRITFTTRHPCCLGYPHQVYEKAPVPRFRRSSLKERGRVKALVTSGLGWFRPRRTRRSRRRGQGSGGARPRSGRRALRSASGSTNTVGGGDSLGSGTRFLRIQKGVRCARHGRGSRLGAGPGGLPVIPTPRQGAA